MNTIIWWHHFVWIIVAAGLGFALTALFADRLRLRRRLFLVPYVVLSGVFLFGYFLWSEIDVTTVLAQNWIWGVLIGALVSVLLIGNVRTQPASRQSGGGDLLLDLTWLGVAYGLTDALFINVMPVLAVWNGLAPFGWTATWPGKIAAAAIALVASLVVTFSYHAGYPEFRNKSMGLVLVGNTIITLAYLLSGNPLGAIIGHMVMHLAAVIQGPDTTVQLPPHPAASR